LHKYLYTHADPVNGIDPTGEFAAAVSIACVSMSMSLGAAGIQAPMVVARQWGIDLNKPVNDPLYQFFEKTAPYIEYAGTYLLWHYGQLPQNIWNGISDTIIGLFNMAIALGNGAIWLGSAGYAPLRIPYIPDFDWSKNLVVQESDSVHDWCKWLGVNVFMYGFAPKMSVGLIRFANDGKPLHFMYAIGDDWYEAMGKPGAMKILGPFTKKKILEHWGGGIKHDTGGIIPILFPSLATNEHGTAYNCLTAVLKAWFRGGGVIFPLVPFAHLATPQS
jgi:hypothetical protein